MRHTRLQLRSAMNGTSTASWRLQGTEVVGVNAANVTKLFPPVSAFLFFLTKFSLHSQNAEILSHSD